MTPTEKRGYEQVATEAMCATLERAQEWTTESSDHLVAHWIAGYTSYSYRPGRLGLPALLRQAATAHGCALALRVIIENRRTA